MAEPVGGAGCAVAKRLKPRLVAYMVLVIAMGVLSTACDAIMAEITGAYRGLPPAREGISGEEIVIRRATAVDSGWVFIIDRTRYVEAGDPYNINRIVKVVTTGATRDQAASLGLQRGDRVVVSTAFGSITKQVGSLSIPDWPGPGRYEYPIGFHSLTAIARAGN
jgi:hypothetical protein